MACSPGPRAAATADFGALARSCPLNSMAPVLAIADLVADRFLIDADRDPVGETLTPIATGPPLVSHTRGARAWPPHERQGLNRKQRRELARRLQAADPGLEVMLHPNAAGIDVGNSAHYVAVRPDRDPDPVRRFDCFTADLHRLADWLQQCGVTTVALQSTGVYWIPVYEILEARGLEVYLVNARHTKNLPGRKSDVQESQWLLKLHTYGLLRNSFHPAAEIRVARTYWRQRGDHVHAVSTCIQRMQKALTQMNIQLANVISDLSGWTGQRIVRAILAGERDPQALAALSHPGIHASRDTIAKSLEGTWQADLLFVLQQEVTLYDAYRQRIEECDQALQQHLKVFADKPADPTDTTSPTSPPGWACGRIIASRAGK